MRTRSVLVLALVVLVGPLAGWIGWTTYRRATLSQQLVQEISTQLEKRFPRAPHVHHPLPGTFGEHYCPLFAALSAEVDLNRVDGPPESNPNYCADVRRGTQPVFAMTAECHAVLERNATLIDRALAATHAEAGGPCEGLTAFSDADDPEFGKNGWLTAQHVARLAGLRIRTLLAQGRVDEALSACVDTEALGRDASLGGGLIGRMVGAAIAEADPAQVTDLERRLASIREALPPMSRSFAEDQLYSQLLAWGSMIPDEQLAVLPPRVRRIASSAAPTAGVPYGAAMMFVLGVPAWGALRDLNAQIAPALDLPREQRRVRFDALRAEVEQRWNPIVKLGFPDWAPFADRHERHLALIDQLIAAVRIRSGQGTTAETILGGLGPFSPELTQDDGVWVLSLPEALRREEDGEAYRLRVRGAAVSA